MNAPPETQQALVATYLLVDFRRCPEGTEASWFKYHGVLKGLTAATTRRIALRLAREPNCMRCNSPLAPTSTGDHIIALAEGGEPGISNYAPLCAPCNSSKHKRDLLEWWQAKGHSFLDLPLDVLTSYARLNFDRAQQRGLLQTPTPAPLAAMVVELGVALPSDEHRYGLRQRTQYMTGRAWPMPDAPQRQTAATAPPARPS